MYSFPCNFFQPSPIGPQYRRYLNRAVLLLKFHKAFLERLKVDYPKLAKVDPELAEELLPEGTSYDPANHSAEMVIYRVARLRGLFAVVVPGLWISYGFDFWLPRLAACRGFS
jgi:hypothetical protein